MTKRNCLLLLVWLLTLPVLLTAQTNDTDSLSLDQLEQSNDMTDNSGDDAQPLDSGVDTTGLDYQINQTLEPAVTAVSNIVFYPIPVGNGLEVPIVLIVLIGAATYFTIYFGFPNVTRFGTAVNVVRGKYDDDNPPVVEKTNVNVVDDDLVDTIRVERAESEEGEVTAFQALTAALSATVGLGNIAGVAIAIALGGPGATFWMILAGFLGMASKFTECTLGVKYRDVDPDGTVHGGPMYYLKKGLSARGMVGFGKVLAVFYAIMMIGGSFGGGNMFQSNQAAAIFLDLLDIKAGYAGTIFGVVLAGLVALVIIGGIKRIGSVTEKIVPFMVGIYVLAALVILGANIAVLPEAIGSIFTGAFTPVGITGGLVGVLIVGFQRAAFSNEAGVGSASVAHSAVKTKYPASEGIVALLEPFIDTVVVCTITALVIIVTNIDGGFVVYGQGDGLNGVNLTSTAFNSVIPNFDIVLTVAVVLFAFSSMISWSYYGLTAWKFLFGKGKAADTLYKVLFCIFVVIGAAMSLGQVVNFSDAMVFAMIFPNMIGLVILAPEVKAEVKRYMSYLRTIG